MFRPKTGLLMRTVIAVTVDVPPPKHAICVQQARGVRPRKPAFTAIAKSKLFRIPKRPDTAKDELAEILRISNQYRLYMRSICNYFKQENESKATGSAMATKNLEAEEVEWEESMLKIKEWNEEIAAQRNERLEKLKLQREEDIRQRILEEENKNQQRLNEIEELVRREKELSKSYITPENIDKAIAQALENKLDFNYAIDVRGNKYVGRYVSASGEEELPETLGEDAEGQMPSLFASSPVSSGFSARK